MVRRSTNILGAPSTPQKNIIDVSTLGVSTTPGGVNGFTLTDTPGSNALSRELFKRQTEVNRLRKEVEPVILQAKRAAITGPVELVKVLIDRLALMMEQYDKVVARYERQLQQIITHMDKKRQGLQALQAETEGSLIHQLTLKDKTLVDLKQQVETLEGQLRLMKREYEQSQRNLATRMAFEEELTEENVRLRADTEQLRVQMIRSKDTGAPGVVQTAQILVEETRSDVEGSLRAALAASQQEVAELKRQRDLFRAPNVPNGDHPPTAEIREIQRAKDAQERYFTDLLESMRLDHGKAIDSLHKQLEEAKHLADTQKAHMRAVKEQLEEQSARALRYSEAIDQASDKCYAENRQLSDALAATKAELVQRDEKMTELVSALEQLRTDHQEAAKTKVQLEARLLEATRSLSSVNSSRGSGQDGGPKQDGNDMELAEARKQISHLEKAILDMTEAKSGESQEGKLVKALQRQLAQVEFEKGKVEEALSREKSKQLPRVHHSTVKPNASLVPNNQRAAEIKAELARLQPASLLDRLGSLLRSRKPSGSTSTTAVDINMEAVQRAYSDIKHSFEGLESTRAKALSLLTPRNFEDSSLAFPILDPASLMQTPTTNRRSFV